MNERIKLLAEQARYRIHNSDGVLVEIGIDEDKFASLIIDECIGIAMNQQQPNSLDIYGILDDYDKGCTDTANLIASKIGDFFYREEE